jgi:MHS family alpha-ketoglutarate permease-like MFS transporter
LIGGQLLAILVLLVLQQLLSVDDLKTWGWRIPFGIGALLAVVAMAMRRDLAETAVFAGPEGRRTGGHAWQLLRAHPRETILVIGLTAGGTAAFYTFTTYMQTFLKLTVGLSDTMTTTVTAAALIWASFLQPVYGAISDRIGRKPLLVFFGAAGAIGTVPILTALQHTRSPLLAFLLLALAWLFVAAYTSINAVVKAELFPASVRATGVGLPYAITVSVFGGTAPAVALWFKQHGHESGFFYYLAGVIAVSLVVYLCMRDTLKESAIR